VTTQPVASRRVTSVLFGDLVGFTSLSENRDQEETRELLTHYFDECRQVIVRYGGTVEKFIGDAVMAVWGVPTAHEDDAERAVRAGLELVNAVSAMGEDVDVSDLAMRVGIVTGEVAVTIGAEHQGMVAGDAVNTAARVQSVAAAGQVWVDETTRLLTSSAISYADVGSHALKGKVDPVPLWSARAVVAAVGGAQRADGLEAPLVGRDRELRLVKELFHAVHESGRPALLVMVGEPGVGKSRLAWEFEKYVDGLTLTVRWHDGRCVAYGEGVAFYALSEAIRARLRGLVTSSDPASGEAGQESVHLLELGLDQFVLDPEERAWLGPRLGALLGIGSVGEFPREDLFSAWTVFLERVGGTDPVVLVIDDAHHADDGLIQFVEHLLAVAEFPCFVVLLSRPDLLESSPTLVTNRRATVSHLSVLGDSDVATLLDGLVVGLPDGVRDSLVARSEGVPLFAVETVRSLIDRDIVVPRGGQYVLADPDALDLDSMDAPASLQALIAARLDTLDSAQHRLVERASVIGNVFSREQIADLCSDLEDVDAVLAGLVRSQILSQMASRFSADFGHYQFVQSVVRQVAYATLSRRDRRATHLAVARQTEEMDDQVGDLAPIIAQHYLEAIEALPSEPDTPELEALAIAQLERAAKRARSLGALTESAGHLLVALDRAKDPATRARLDSAVAWALHDDGDYDRAIPHARAATEAFDAMPDPLSAALAAAAHGAALSSTGDNAGALAIVEPRWANLSEMTGADAALLALGKVLNKASRYGDERRDVLDRRIQIAEKIGDGEQLADALIGLSVSYSEMAAPETAKILMLAAADLVRTQHDPVALARCLFNLNVEYNRDDLDKAVEIGREAVEVAAKAGVAIWQDYTEGNLMLALLASGRWSELDERLDRAKPRSLVAQVIHAGVLGSLCVAREEPFVLPWSSAEVPKSDNPSDDAWATFATALHAQSEGRLDDALEAAVRAVDVMFAMSGASDDFVHMWPVATELAFVQQDTATLDRLLAIVDTASERMRIPVSIRAHRARFGGLMARNSDPESVEELLSLAVEGFGAWGSVHHRARAKADLGSWLRTVGRTEEGDQLLADAHAVLTEMQARAWLTQLDWQAVRPP
jgi:class 3 adenylate cyclase/tetratricopeptide (TPR) repeat protein